MCESFYYKEYRFQNASYRFYDNVRIRNIRACTSLSFKSISFREVDEDPVSGILLPIHWDRELKREQLIWTWRTSPRALKSTFTAVQSMRIPISLCNSTLWNVRDVLWCLRQFRIPHFELVCEDFVHGDIWWIYIFKSKQICVLCFPNARGSCHWNCFAEWIGFQNQMSVIMPPPCVTQAQVYMSIHRTATTD